MPVASRYVELPDDFQGDGFIQSLALCHEDEKLEAPLYGVWGPCLAKYLRTPVGVEDILVHTYPQYPADLLFDVGEMDVHGSDEQGHNRWVFRGRSDLNLQMLLRSHVERTPSPLGQPLVNSTALRTPDGDDAPVESSNPGSEILITKLDLARAIAHVTSPNSPSNSSVATPPPKRSRATAVPDFTQIWRIVDKNEHGKWMCDSDGTVMFFAENKKHMKFMSRVWQWVEMRISIQTFRQARHVFSTSKNTKVLGVMHILGYYWRYFEYIRSKAFDPPSADEENDPTYEPETSSGSASRDSSDPFADNGDTSDGLKKARRHEHIPEFIKTIFNGRNYLHLIDDYEDTKAALAAIGAEIYYGMEERTCGSDSDSEDDEDDDDGDDNEYEGEGGDEWEGEERDRDSDVVSYLDEVEGAEVRQRTTEDSEEADDEAARPDYGSDEFQLSAQADSDNLVQGPPISEYDEDEMMPGSEDSEAGDKSGDYIARDRD
ncbi:uncharacterized protein PHACADRAFT_214464 [Phanerochaete carnosa HHB-10118-sp]|uniref:Uncharacterized protein n=1 Tax=Phanerochaete carnosa (strain HHB-10118-sp) TaxID=650164 RepID=K5UI69_PHACS|nr:uncharacterized protein PHACADRAFT_214464 [Phanerochaete carnosa HHB-10118-sp]EKM49216.1 hypothetical protein PHACADRAFT_214464 [Phanerochaete carnosa HHB-10118-sp]